MSVFKFKQFQVEQQNDVFKIGTDGLLLATWVSAQNPKDILDIGTGTGLISLVLAQRFPNASITGIDVQSNAVDLAQKNFKHSPWHNRLTAKHSSLQDMETRSYDLIVSNPPFFENRLKSPDNASKNIARHNDSLPFSAFSKGINRLLSTNGVFAIVLPFDEFQSFAQLLKDEGIHLYSYCEVKGHADAPVKRILATFTREDKFAVKKEALTLEKSRHQYTEEYKSLIQDFLLKA